DDPAHDVSQQAASAKNRGQHPDQPDKSNVEVEEFRQPESHPGDLPAGDGAHQSYPGYGRPHPPAAIGAKIGVFLNDFSAIVAIHESPSIRWSTIRRTSIKSSQLCLVVAGIFSDVPPMRLPAMPRLGPTPCRRA